MSWAPVSGATVYDVSFAYSPELPNFGSRNSVPVTGTSLTKGATALATEVNQYVRVRARNAEGVSPWSELVSKSWSTAPGARRSPAFRR